MDLPWIKAFMESRRTEADKIQTEWSQELHRPSEDEIKRAALLAWEGHLTSVENMRIMNMSIRDIPLDHIEKLASVVTGVVNIQTMNHTDHLGSILASIKCKMLWLCDMELSEAENQALVTAMRDRVQFVSMTHVNTMDVEEFTQYDGQGCCSCWFMVGGNTWRIHRVRLRRWAADKGWRVTINDFGGLEMKRK